MMCTLLIKRHINKLSPTEIFTTRDMLIYGLRSTVDSSLSRLVREGTIKRLALGVFVRKDDGRIRLAQIVETKMRAFKKELIKPGIVESNQGPMSLSKQDEQEMHAPFYKVGNSSSFNTIHGRVTIKGMSERKLYLLRDKVGQATLTLWKTGRRFCKPHDVWQSARHFNRTEKSLFRRLASVMPAWLQELCGPYFSKPLATF